MLNLGETTTVNPTGEKKSWFVIYDYEIIESVGEKIVVTSSVDGVSECWQFGFIGCNLPREDLYETYEKAKVAFIASLEEEINWLSEILAPLKGQ